MRRFAVVLGLAVVATGCGGITGSFVAMKAYPQRQARHASEIELFMEGDMPQRPLSIVGALDTDWPWKGRQADRQEVFQALRDAAAKNGLDGVLNIRCAGVGIVGPGLCSGSGFVYTD